LETVSCPPSGGRTPRRRGRALESVPPVLSRIKGQHFCGDCRAYGFKERACVGHASGEIGFDICQRKRSDEPGCSECPVRESGPSANSDNWDTGLGGRLADAQRCFSTQALVVQASLSGDHEGRATDTAIQVNHPAHNVDAGLDAGGQNSHGRVPDTTGCAGTRLFCCDGCPRANFLLEDSDQPGQCAVEEFHIAGGGSFLGPENGGGTLFPEQRVVHVAGKDEPRLP
jgi:hypothetical protein